MGDAADDAFDAAMRELAEYGERWYRRPQTGGFEAGLRELKMVKRDIEQRKSTAPALPLDFAAKLSSGIAESRSQTRIAGGKPFLRLLKEGLWVYGQEDIEVEPGSYWVLNLMSLAHGWSCWVERGKGQKNELVGEIMDSMSNPRPARPEPIEDTAYQEQRGFELKCLTGEDAGTEVLYKTASVGGMRAVDGLLAAIQKRLAEEPEYVFPVLQLQEDSYNHTKWGKTYVPVLTIVGWADVNGELDKLPSDADYKKRVLEEDPVPPETGTPRRRATAVREQSAEDLPASVTKPTRRRAAGEPADASAPTPPPTSTTQAHTGQRRRPGR